MAEAPTPIMIAQLILKMKEKNMNNIISKIK